MKQILTHILTIGISYLWSLTKRSLLKKIEAELLKVMEPDSVEAEISELKRLSRKEIKALLNDIKSGKNK